MKHIRICNNAGSEGSNSRQGSEGFEGLEDLGEEEDNDDDEDGVEDFDDVGSPPVSGKGAFLIMYFLGIFFFPFFFYSHLVLFSTGTDFTTPKKL